MKRNSFRAHAMLIALVSSGLAAPAMAGNIDKSTPMLMHGTASGSATCFDSKGKPVVDAAVCDTDRCVDASGAAISDASVCASSSSSSSGDAQGVAAPRDAASGMATGKRQHSPVSP